MSRRGLGLLLIPLALGLAAILDHDGFDNVARWMLALFPLVNWTAATILVRASRHAPDVVSLRARADDAVMLALAATIVGLVGVLRQSGVLDQETGRALRTLAVVTLSLPALSWLIVWWRLWRD